MNKQAGLTLIEMSIVLVIIGLIIGAVTLNSTGLIGNTKITSTISLIKDLSGAVVDFKSRYHYLPGDLPNAGDDIPEVASNYPQCNIAPNGTIGNGLIDTNAEINCVPVLLVLGGFIKGNPAGIISPFNNGATPDVSVRWVNKSAVYQINSANPFLPTVQNVIEIQNIPCDAAIAIDSRIDDGDTSKGNVMSNPVCVIGVNGMLPTTTLDVGI